MADYVTSAQLKATLGITGTGFDADLQASATGASRAIDKLCNRRFYADADANQVRYYSPVEPGLLQIDDLVTLTSLLTSDDGTTFGNTWTLNTDFVLQPLNAAADAEVWPYTSIKTHPNGSFLFNTFYPRSVQLTGKFGWAAVPAPVFDATTLLAERLYKMKREAPLGVQVFADVAMRIARADSNLMMSIGPYRKVAAAVA